VPTVEELDRLLDEMAALCRPDQPTIVKLEVPPTTVTFGLGAPESFVQLQWSDDPPYRVTVGDQRAQGAVPFFLFGEYHTEIPRRNVILTSTARLIVREIYGTGEESTAVPWEDV
jgi:hypothetical protein